MPFALWYLDCFRYDLYLVPLARRIRSRSFAFWLSLAPWFYLVAVLTVLPLGYAVGERNLSSVRPNVTPKISIIDA